MKGCGGGWEDGVFIRNGREMARYTRILRWFPDSEASAWYGLYAEKLREAGYESLGLQR